MRRTGGIFKGLLAHHHIGPGWFIAHVVNRIRAVEVATVKDRPRTWPLLMTYINFNKIPKILIGLFIDLFIRLIRLIASFPRISLKIYFF
jgi:hypothetical protein